MCCYIGSKVDRQHMKVTARLIKRLLFKSKWNFKCYAHNCVIFVLLEDCLIKIRDDGLILLEIIGDVAVLLEPIVHARIKCEISEKGKIIK